MPVRPLLAALLLLAVPVVHAAGEAPVAGVLTVRVYDAAALPHEVQGEALRMAGDIVRTAGVDVIWLACDDTTARCASPIVAGEAAVRFVRLPGTAPASRWVALGDTLIDRERALGVLATIYCDRVDALARATQVATPLLLARALAHEVGHLLLASRQHDDAGLMRAVWRREELQRNRAQDWVFTSADAARIRTSRDAVRRQARSLPRSPSSSSGAAGSDAGWSDTLPLQ